MLTLIFIRHGQSVDNIRNVWAGWRDGALTNHGMQQAAALGQHWADIPIHVIYASNLLRAHSTAIALLDAQTHDPKPPLILSPLLREHHFGVAEGRRYTTFGELDIQRGVFPVLKGRDAKFPEGESLNDVQRRAEQALDELLMPHIHAAKGKSPADVRIAVVSHGLCIAELLSVIFSRTGTPTTQSFRGLHNTAYTTIQAGIKVHFPSNSPRFYSIMTKIPG